MPLEMLVSKRSRKLRRYTDRFSEMEEEGEPENEPDAPRSAAVCVSYAARAASAKSACAAKSAAAARRPRERRRDKTASSRDGDDARVTRVSDEDAARDRVRRAGSRAERADDETRRARRGARSEVAVDAIASIVGVTRSRTGCARRSETLLTWRLARPALEFFTNNRFAFCSTRPSHLRAPNSRVRGVSFAAMSTVATRAALVVPAARGASGGRARSSGVSRPRRRTAARRRPDCASSAMRPSDEGNPTTDVTSFSRPADGKQPVQQPVPSPTSRLSNVCFVLCRPQGPANVGGIARVMNNFGITDLRVVAPEPGALAPPFDALMDDGSDRAIHSAKDRSTAPFADEARIMAVHAAHLLRDAGRFETAADAVADCVFVAATTARPRENLPIVSVRDACASVSQNVSRNASQNANSSLSLTDATNDGKVAILFGNEATGLTNEELSLANVGVMIPTASFGVPDQSGGGEGKKNEGIKKKIKRYTGGVGPTSLNLSHAVGVCAYEVHQAMGDTLVSGFNSRLITAEERVRLADELHKARRALDVLRTPETRDATNDGTSSDPTDASGTSGTTTDVERLEHARERRAIANVLNAGPIASRDAAALFALARRVAVASSFSGTDAAVLAAARAFFLTEKTEKTEKTDGGRAAVVKALIKAVREACGVSMTAREAERVIEALGKPEEGLGETSAKREGNTSSTDSTDR